MAPLNDIFSRNVLDRLFGSGDGQVYYVIHPLDDEPEEKCDPSKLGPLKLSRGERFALYVMQGYLVVMLMLAIYRIVDLAHVTAPQLMH